VAAADDATAPGRVRLFDDAREPHAAIVEIERHHLLVRDGTSFGLPHHVRLAARPAADVDRLLVALTRELSP